MAALDALRSTVLSVAKKWVMASMVAMLAVERSELRMKDEQEVTTATTENRVEMLAS